MLFKKSTVRVLRCIAIALLLLSCSISTVQATPATDAYKQGKAILDRKDYKAAIIALDINAKPLGDSWSNTVSKAALAQARGGRVSATAEELLQQAQKLATVPYTQFETARLLGYLYRQQRRYQLAEVALKRCLKVGNTYEYLQGAGIEQDLIALYDQMGRPSDAASMRKAAKETEQHDEHDVRLLTPYMTRLTKTIKSRWIPPAREAGYGTNLHYQTICNWVIDKTGRFSLIHVSKSSGDEVLDTAAVAYSSERATRFRAKKHACHEELYGVV